MYINPDAWLQKIPPVWLDWAERTTAWIQRQLSASYWALLSGLPVSETIVVGDGYRLFVCHADPNDTWAKMCAPAAPQHKLQTAFGGLDADIVAYGHYHSHHVMRLDSKILANVASVGVRSDGLSAYTLVENINGQLVIQQFQVPYDTAEETRLTQLRGVPQP
jgi:predicted phosphodiesterase